jgi:hypothetical protein
MPLSEGAFTLLISQKSQIIQYIFVEISVFHETYGSFNTYL